MTPTCNHLLGTCQLAEHDHRLRIAVGLVSSKILMIKITESTRVALIALAGVVLSAIVSFIVSSTQSQAAATNLRLEFEQRFNQKLFERRLEIYPVLYRTLSELGKSLEERDLFYKMLANARVQINAWDSENAVIVSPAVIHRILTLRNLLTEMALGREQEAQVAMADRRLLFKAALSLEQALRAELGVYTIEGFHSGPIADDDPHGWKFLKKEESLVRNQQ